MKDKLTSHKKNLENIQIIISPERLCAYIELKDYLIGKKDELFKLIIDQLKAEGITNGIINQNIWDLLAFMEHGISVLVAETNLEEIMGRDAQLIYKFKTEPEKIRRLMADGNTDYYDLAIVKNTKVKGLFYYSREFHTCYGHLRGKRIVVLLCHSKRG